MDFGMVDVGLFGVHRDFDMLVLFGVDIGMVDVGLFGRDFEMLLGLLDVGLFGVIGRDFGVDFAMLDVGLFGECTGTSTCSFSSHVGLGVWCCCICTNGLV